MNNRGGKETEQGIRKVDTSRDCQDPSLNEQGLEGRMPLLQTECLCPLPNSSVEAQPPGTSGSGALGR